MGGAAMRALLCGEDGSAESGPGAVFPLAADWVFRRHRQRARDCVAGGRFAGAAEFSGCRTERDGARSLDDLGHPAADRRGNASSSVPLGAGIAGREDLLKGKTIGIDATTLEANAALRSI